MIKISFLAAELIYTCIWFMTRCFVWKHHKSIQWKREAVLILMYLNLAVIIRLVFFPRELLESHIQPLIFDFATAFPFRINIVPLVRLFDFNNTRDIIWNVIGNTAMFIPSGILLPIAYKKLDRFWKVVATGALISLCIELLQLPFPSRASDIDDLLLNTLGVAVGYGIDAIVKQLKRSLRRRT